MPAISASTCLRLSSGPLTGKIFEIQQALRIGRHPFNEVSLADSGVSRYHCWLVLRDGVPTIEDLASANGTFVNGERLRSRHALQAGDVVRVGTTEFVFTEAA